MGDRYETSGRETKGWYIQITFLQMLPKWRSVFKCSQWVWLMLVFCVVLLDWFMPENLTNICGLIRMSMDFEFYKLIEEWIQSKLNKITTIIVTPFRLNITFSDDSYTSFLNSWLSRRLISKTAISKK